MRQGGIMYKLRFVDLASAGHNSRPGSRTLVRSGQSCRADLHGGALRPPAHLLSCPPRRRARVAEAQAQKVRHCAIVRFQTSRQVAAQIPSDQVLRASESDKGRHHYGAAGTRCISRKVGRLHYPRINPPSYSRDCCAAQTLQPLSGCVGSLP